MQPQEPNDIIPELGDLLTIVSDLYTSTTGRIIYRDGAMIRVRPTHVSDRAIDFPLDPETGLFRDSLGVSEVILHEKAVNYHFSKQLSVLPGDILEFYAVDGTPVGEPGIVAAVIADERQDAIQLEDGRLLNFRFLGPEPPVAVILPRSPPEDVAIPENNSGMDAAAAEAAEAEEAEEDFPELDMSWLPAALVEEIPTSERTYSDTVQREDMFVSLLLDIPVSKQKNPRVLRSLYRKTDLLLALKNSVVVRDDTGGVVADAARSYIPNTIREVMTLRSGAIPAILPVAALKKVVYLDAPADTMDDVDILGDAMTLLEASANVSAFRGSEAGNPFLSYMDFLLRRNLPSFTPAVAAAAVAATAAAATTDVVYDHDVLRSRLPPEPVQGLPADLPPASVAVGADFVATIEDRSARVLSATTFTSPKTGLQYQIAPADSAATVGHVILSSTLTRPAIRSSVLLWDIAASEAVRRSTQPFYRALIAAWSEQRVLRTGDEEDDIALSELIEERIVPSALSILAALPTLDAIGLRTLELSEPLMKTIAKAIAAGRMAWDTAMESMREHVLDSLQAEQIPVFPLVEDSPLWSADVVKQEDVQKAVAAMEARETTIAGTSTARMSYMSAIANGTLLPVWFQTANGVVAVPEQDVATYRSERRRLGRRLANLRAAEAELAATPELNTCKHVYLLESIRGIREDGRRFKVLQDFLNTYQAGQRGNWIICGSCDKSLLCRHELMLLNEYMNPGRSVALHKALLLEFGGPVFEGAYICKNCGQRIAELEYDSHLEYSDDGTPLVGRMTIADHAEEDELIPGDVLGEVVPAETAENMNMDPTIFQLIRTVFEHCGVVPTKELYDRMGPAVRDFLREKMPSREFYDARRARAIAEKAKVVLPPFHVYESNSRIGAVGALTTLELLTQDISIPFPARGCKFVRGGFPLESAGSASGSASGSAGSTLNYVACVMAGVLRNDAPWNSVAWAAETSLPKRQAATEMAIRQSMNLILALPGPTGIAPAPLTTVTDFYQTALASVRNKESDKEQGLDLPSRADILPETFRPIPFPAKSEKEKEEAVPNASKLKTDVADGAIVEVKSYIGSRAEGLSRLVVSEFHTSSLASARAAHILSEGNPRSDANCCFRRLAAVELDGNGVASLAEQLGEATFAELALIQQSAIAIQRRDPATSAAGTHFIVPWSAPIQRAPLPKADATMYYRLFLKHCFRGPNVGSVHEFGASHVCRFCEFQIPAELTYMTASDIAETDGKKFERALLEQAEQRKELAIQAFQEQGVSITDQTFQELEDAIKTRRLLHPAPPGVIKPLPVLLEIMLDMLRKAGIVSSSQQDWAMLQQAVQSQQANQVFESPRRRQLYAGFSRRQDELLQAIEMRMIDLAGPRPTQSTKDGVRKALESFLLITDPVEGAQGARTCLQHFVVNAEKIATAFTVHKPKATKWFPRVNRSHVELLNDIWARAGKGVDSALVGLDDLPAAAKELARTTLVRLTGWLGPWLRMWISDLTATETPDTFTVSELQMILRWSILQFMAALITDQSVLFSSAAADIRLATIQFFRGWLLDTLRIAGEQVAKYNMSEQEIQDAILARKELEKASFIKKLDVLDKDMRKVELIKKKLKIGDWAVGTVKNLFQYDADFYEFQRAQRAAMGLPEFEGAITGAVGEAGAAVAENPFGFMDFGARMLGTEDHRVVHDEDAF